MNQRVFRRFLWMIALFSIIYFLLVGRLAYIQLWATEHFSHRGVNLIKQSVQQRQQKFVLHSGRGEITDRYGQPFTGKSTYVVTMFPLMNKTAISREKLDELARLLSIGSGELVETLEKVREPLIFRQQGKIKELTEEEAELVNQLGIPGILGLPYELRYPPEQMLAQHLIGYLGQNREVILKEYREELAQGLLEEDSEIGISGLERTFQPFLLGVGPTTLAYYVDGRGEPLSGIEVKYRKEENPFYPLSIRTTLDYDLQLYLEHVLDRYQVKEGAFVILDAKNSEILAMASRPNFDRQKERMEAWENKAIKRYPLGSVFKIVVAAAALEEELVQLDTTFICDGVLEGTNFHCWLKEGHGQIRFDEAFAQSCNLVFGQLAQQLGADLLEAYADKLGLLSENGWQIDALFHLDHFKQLDREEKGQVFAPARSDLERNDPLYLLQTGIGQLDVQATPLAVANMLATILRGGQKQQVKAVQSIQYQTGMPFYHFAKQKLEGEAISPYTAYQLQHLLALVTERGTASQVLKDRKWKAAGKTGTAQALKYDPDQMSAKVNHHWFAGYYPQHHPKYVLVSLALNRPVGARNVSVELFSELVDWLDQGAY